MGILRENGFIILYLPANCTSVLQPLDLSFNAALKRIMTDSFLEYQSQKFHEQIQSSAEQLKLDLRISVIKPEHAKWLMRSFDELKNRAEIVTKGWEMAGISDVLARKDEIITMNRSIIQNPFK